MFIIKQHEKAILLNNILQITRHIICVGNAVFYFIANTLFRRLRSIHDYLNTHISGP